jgi:hypothetical protein
LGKHQLQQPQPLAATTIVPAASKISILFIVRVSVLNRLVRRSAVDWLTVTHNRRFAACSVE